MKTIKSITLILMSLSVIDQALAQGLKIFDNPISCKIKETGKDFATFSENNPSVGLVTMQLASGEKSILSLSEKVEKIEGGCFSTDKITKKYFHPYYEIQIEEIHHYGQDGTRCAGAGESYVVNATYIAEMQAPQALKCQMNPSVDSEIFY